LIKEEVKKEVK